MNTEDLILIKNSIEVAKTEKAELEGERKALMNTLDKEWGCKTIRQAKKKLTQWQEEINNLEKEIQDGLNELEEKYEFE